MMRFIAFLRYLQDIIAIILNRFGEKVKEKAQEKRRNGVKYEK